VRCRLAVAPVRESPRDEAQQVTQALLHEPLEVGERDGGWVAVVTAYGYPGWMREDAIEGGEGTLPVRSGLSPLAAAFSFLGAPYEWGGLSELGIDCSGLVHLAHRLAGQLVPRDAWQQEAAGPRVAAGEEQPGDLVS
jgi:gamma-D-glutamyl-L-lysine dipeptidyl-peptidase